MAQASVEEAVQRFNAALENLGAALERRKLSEDSLTSLEEDLHLMALDRAQLARRLDEALVRSKAAANLKSSLIARIDGAILSIDQIIEEAA